MPIGVVSTYVAGNTIDILVQLKNVRTGLPTASSTVSMTLQLYDSTGLLQVNGAAMSVAANTPPGYWLYTFQSSTAGPLGTWNARFTAVDTAGNTWISTSNAIFNLVSGGNQIPISPAPSPV